MRTLRVIPVVAVLCAALVLPSQAAAAPTVPEYAATADNICRTTVAKHGKLLADFGTAVKKNRRRSGYKLGKRVVRALKGEYLQIKRLAPPAGQEANVARWLKAKRSALKVMGKMPRAFLKRGRKSGRRYAAKADRYIVAGARHVRGFPFKVCS